MDKTPVQEILAWLGEKELSPLADHIRKEFLPKEKVFVGEVWDAGETSSSTKSVFLSQYYKD